VAGRSSSVRFSSLHHALRAWHIVSDFENRFEQSRAIQHHLGNCKQEEPASRCSAARADCILQFNSKSRNGLAILKKEKKNL